MYIQKHRRRVETLRGVIKTKEGAVDAEAWRLLLWVIERFGVDGMSSDESMDEGGVLQVCALPWRRNIEEYLKIIDDERSLNLKRYPRQGSKAMVRKRTADAPRSSRKATPRLPLSFYDEGWLHRQDEGVIDELDASDEEWMWPTIKVVL